MSLRFLPKRRLPQLLQSEAAECGLACIAMIAGYYGLQDDLPAWRRRWTISMQGADLAQLMRMARSLALAPRAVRAELAELKKLKLPCVLHWNLDHFVVLESVGGSRLVVNDPACGRRSLSWKEMGRSFTGIALELEPLPAFRRQRRNNSLGLAEMLATVPGIASSLAGLLAVSLALQCVLLLLPFYSQLVIDEVLVTFDLSLLHLLAFAAALLMLAQVLLTMLRSWMVLTIATHINSHWVVGVFHHLLRLPLDYFEKRQLGDVQSRFGSLNVLQQLLSQQVAEALVDGLMAVTIAGVMLLYNVALANVVLVSVALAVCVRLAFFPFARRASRRSLQLAAAKDSHFLESLRGVQTIKCFAREPARETQFHHRVVEAWNASVAVGRLGIWQNGITQCIYGLQMIVVLWLGAQAVINSAISVGMLIAFLSYRSLFTERAATLIDKLLQFRLASVQLERLADIVCSDVEPAFREPVTASGSRGKPFSLHVSGVSYRYAEDTPAVLHDVSLQVASGEHVVITGASGCGKSTLLKVMMGLFPASHGVIRVNHRRLEHFGLQRFRAASASVMQEDRLFSGNLLDNISFFASRPDLSAARSAAEIAGIDDVIMNMPMQYLSRVGDMGAALSGGQRQRVLLARALYSKPKILFLDEFTSHLDPDAERDICERLARLPITLVVIAHRAETIRHADREIRLQAVSADLPIDRN